MKNHRRAGFTLVEVMLTLLIMAGIMITITQILTATRRSRDLIHNIQERLLAGPAILDRLERDLRAIAIYNRDERSFLRVEDRVQDGYDADTLDFVTTVDGLIPYREHAGEDFRRADINEAGYRLRPTPGSDEFLQIYRREDFGVDEEPFEGGSFSLLHDRVKGFDIKVFAEDGPEAEPLDAWGVDEEDDEKVGLPLRLEVELTIELRSRLVGEQLVQDPRTMTYRRVYHFPPSLLLAQSVRPVPTIPDIQPPVAPTTAGGPAAGATGTGAGGTTTTGGDGAGLPFGGGGGGSIFDDNRGGGGSGGGGGGGGGQ
ncbi:MAG: prepilin-type N-terminal cleavage/methylation domain-containing protein [Planctomycetota bacterium]